MIDESDLRLCLQRAAQAVGKDDPETARVLGAHLLGTCGLLSDEERAARYRELGGTLLELGQLYLTAATERPGPARR